MEYHLHPPEFVIAPQISFDEAWEDFCRQLLCLYFKTPAIRRRTPPDQGMDLIWDAQNVLYQCKVSETGLPGSLHMGNVKKSLRDALMLQPLTGWQTYVLCTNVDLTAPQESELREILPDILLYGRGFWVDRCREFHHQIAERFQVLCPISPQISRRALNQAYLHEYEQMYPFPEDPSLMSLLVYSNRYRGILELPVPITCTADDVILLLRALLCAPETRIYSDQNCSVMCHYELHISNQRIEPTTRVCEIDLHSGARPLVALWRVITWYRDMKVEDKIQVLEGIEQPGLWIEASSLDDINTRIHSVIEQYEQFVNMSLQDAWKNLIP
jgi:hypothetical protein